MPGKIRFQKKYLSYYITLRNISNTAFNYQTAISQLDTCIRLAGRENMNVGTGKCL